MTIFSVDRHPVNDGVLRLAVAGEVDLGTSEILEDEIRDVITNGRTAELFVDLDQVTFLDSTGVHVLVAGQALAAERGVAYHVTNPRGIVHKTADITGVLAALTDQP